MFVKLVGIKFILHSGNYLCVTLPEKDSLDIVQKWQQRHYHLKSIPSITGSSAPNGDLWGVEVNQIAAVHTYTPEQQQPPGLVKAVRSGI